MAPFRQDTEGRLLPPAWAWRSHAEPWPTGRVQATAPDTWCAGEEDDLHDGWQPIRPRRQPLSAAPTDRERVTSAA